MLHCCLLIDLGLCSCFLLWLLAYAFSKSLDLLLLHVASHLCLLPSAAAL